MIWIEFVPVPLVFITISCKKENKAEQYLACYALEPSLKQICVGKLAKQYIAENLWQDTTYVKSFQYKSEKLGFKQFLNNKTSLVTKSMKEFYTITKKNLM